MILNQHNKLKDTHQFDQEKAQDKMSMERAMR